MRRTLSSALVAAQFLLLLALALVPRGALWPLSLPTVIGAAIIIVAGIVVAGVGLRGLGAALTASPVPIHGASLVTSGIYGLIRHPIYTGLLIAGLGLMVLGASFWHIFLWVALLILLAGKSRWEEDMLTVAHPDYRAYGARTGRFVPGIGRLR